MITSLKPFFTYFGGKWRAAPHYPAPHHQTIIEPFAGSAGYGMRYPHCAIILADKDPVITSVWEYLIRVSPQEILSLPDLLPQQSVDDLNVCIAAKYLIGFWLNKGVERPMKTPSAWMRAGTHSTSFWGEAIRQRIASQLEFIRHWQVIEGDYAGLDNQRATWFVDPPYSEAGQRYVCGAKTIDYRHLGNWCLQRSGQIIVCENEGAAWLPFKPFKSIKSTEGHKRLNRSAEVIYTAIDGWR